MEVRRLQFFRVSLALLVAGAAIDGQALLPAPSRGFLKHFTVDSFGYGPSAAPTGYEFSPAFDSAFYNLHQLTCPLCTPGRPLGRTRAILPPFGARTSFAGWNDRLILFTGLGGIDAVPQDGSPRLNPILMRANSSTDDWIVTSDVGASVAVDPQKRLSLGFTKGFVQDFGPIRHNWSTTSGSVGVSPDLVRQLVHGVKGIKTRSQDAAEKQQ